MCLPASMPGAISGDRRDKSKLTPVSSHRRLACVRQDSCWAIPSCQVGVNVPDLFSLSKAIAWSWMLKPCGWIAPQWRHRAWMEWIHCTCMCVLSIYRNHRCLNMWEFKSTYGYWHLTSWTDTTKTSHWKWADLCLTKRGFRCPHSWHWYIPGLVPLLAAMLEEKIQKGWNLRQGRSYWGIKPNTVTAYNCSAWVHVHWGDHLSPWDPTRGFAPQWAPIRERRLKILIFLAILFLFYNNRLY